MEHFQAFKFELIPDGEQARRLRGFPRGQDSSRSRAAVGGAQSNVRFRLRNDTWAAEIKTQLRRSRYQSGMASMI